MEKTNRRQPQSDVPLYIRLFGSFTVQVLGKPIPPLRTRKEQWLLALLILRSDHDTPRDWLAGTLWPESEESMALSHLRRSLSNLRKALGPEAYRITAPSPRTVRLDLTDAWCDALAFDNAIQTGMRDEARGMSKAGNREKGIGNREQSPASCLWPHASSLSEAVSLYTGPLLENCYELWAQQERSLREQHYLGALQTLAQQAIEKSLYAEAVDCLRRILAVDPLRELAYRMLMETLAANGEQAEALQIYRQLRVLLRRELNAAPDLQTVAIYERLRAPRAPAAPLRLKQEDNAPFVITPPARLSSSPLPSLPAIPTRLIGREREIEAVTARLREARLLTLTGMGGIGKTRLAMAVAQTVYPDYPGGVWFLPLADVSRPGDLMEAIRDGLRLPALPTDPMEQVCTRLEGCPTLLVLDNFESLLPQGAQSVQQMLERLPLLTLLVTSRLLLRLSSEWEYTVPPLPLPNSDTTNLTPETCLQFAGVALFVERARMRRADFRLTASNSKSVMALCLALEGIPLAVELAAAWVRTLTPEQIRTRLQRRFEFLQSAQVDVPPRHRSLRAALEASLGLLPPQTKRFLAWLTVFQGGWTLETAEALFKEEVLEQLTALRDASLLIAEEREEGVRYRFLETVRAFAAEQQTEEERQQFARRHAEYWLAFALEAEAHLLGPEQKTWMDRLERDYENCRAALDWFAAGSREQIRAGLRFAAALMELWVRRSYQQEGPRRLTELLARLGEEDTSPERACALCALGTLMTRRGDSKAARTAYEQALALHRANKDSAGAARALAGLGELMLRQEPEQARLWMEQALTLAQQTGLEALEADCIASLGYQEAIQENYAEARRLFSQALAINRRRGNLNAMIWNLGHLGRVACFQGEDAEATMLTEEAREIARALGSRSEEAWTNNCLALIARQQGAYGQACLLLEEALHILHEIGEPASQTLCELGQARFENGEYLPAREALEEAQRIQRSFGTPDAPHISAQLEKVRHLSRG